MSVFSRIHEKHARRLRWFMLAVSVLLFASLLTPSLTVPLSSVPAQCAESGDLACQVQRQPGVRLLWGTVIPTGLLLMVLGHEIWRRICPLSFVSQLGRALGLQRTRVGKGGKPQVLKVEPQSWLGQHHVQLQWSLLITGLTLRLLVVNGDPFWLAIMFIATFLAAIVVGWAFGGKTWCHYICPVAPVEFVVNGMRGFLDSPAHVGNRSKITQSMCRTISSDGREKSACIACQAPCIDIDSERVFWQTLRGKRGLSWAWYSYPGLVISFFLLMNATGAGSGFVNNKIGYLRSGEWAYDAGLPHRALLPLTDALPIPRLLLIPIALTAAGMLSVLLFRGLERVLRLRYKRKKVSQHAELAIQHARLLATFLAINSFFWFVDPLQGALGPNGGQIVRSFVLIVMSAWLYRSWRRDQATYRRESTSDSLRRQLVELPGLEGALDGRSLESLSPDEVFTLVKTLPVLGTQLGRKAYREVMAEMLRTGRLERAASLLELQELRNTLHLEEADHHAVLRELAEDQPDLLASDSLQLQADDLRREVAVEGLEDLLRITGLKVLDLSTSNPDLLDRLEKLRLECGLNDEDWQRMLKRFGPKGELEQERLNSHWNTWIEEAGLHASLEKLAATDPILRPLERAMAFRMEDRRLQLQPRLLAAGMKALPVQVAPSGGLNQVLDLLWQDPDPDTAGWVLMLERQRYPERVPQRLQDSRNRLEDSPFLLSQRCGDLDPDLIKYLISSQRIPSLDLKDYPRLASPALFSDLLPEGLLWVARNGYMKSFPSGALVFEKGNVSDSIALVLDGEVHLRTATANEVVLRSGETVGEMGVIRDEPRTATVLAGPTGARVFILSAVAFDDLLNRSRTFTRGLLAQLAERLGSS